jgi:hypothetical protein
MAPLAPDSGTTTAHGGEIVFETPIVGGRAWRRFRDDFAALDVPRRTLVPSPAGVEAMAQAAGLAVVDWEGWTPVRDYVDSMVIRKGASPAVEHPADVLGDEVLAWCAERAAGERGAEATRARFRLTTR